MAEGVLARKFATALVSSRHGRRGNEDAAAYGFTDILGCWVVADGLGGHGGGETASRLAVDTILASCLRKPEISPAALRGYLDAAQTAIRNRQAQEPELAEMRTTVVLLVANGLRAQWAHVGDSRLYHLRLGRLLFQTGDHSVPQILANAGDIAPGDIRRHEDRNRLLRALGQEGELKPTVKPSPEPVQPGEAFLLCTDGFWEYVLEGEMLVDLAKSATPKDWLQRLEARLWQRTLHQQVKNPDNYTALAVWVQA